MGVSIDQAQYCLELVQSHFPLTTSPVSRASTPLRYDNDYWTALVTSAPLSPIQLVEMERKYHGSYRHHIGSLQYLATYTRPDIVYSVQRLATFNNNPTALAFEGIHRIYRYLAHDIIRPLFFPCAHLETTEHILSLIHI